MAFQAIYGLNVSLTAATAAGAGLLQIDPSAASALAAQLGSNFTYASLSDGVNYEIVKINSVSSPNLNVTRAQDGTPTSAFPEGACIRFVWNAEGIQATAAGVTFTVVGTGAATVTGTSPNFTVNVPVPAITGTLPIEVMGSYPAWEIDFQGNFGGCCCGSSGGGGGGTITEITGSGLATVTSGTGPIANVSVTAPNFIAGANMTITGTWPNITFASSGGGGGGGVASVTGSAKILLSGTPTNPVINLVTTGAGGVYNGITFDAWGTATSTNPAYIPITTLLSSNPGVAITYPTPGTANFLIADASTTVRGVLALAPPTVAGSNNPGDAATAVTPAGLNAVITSLASLSLNGNFSYTPDPGANYTNTLSPTATIPLLPIGAFALITASATVTDSALGAGVVPVWGLGVFDISGITQGIKAISTANHIVRFVVAGPTGAPRNLTLKTTALTGTSTVVSQQLDVLVIP